NRLAEAEDEYGAAIRIQPALAEAHCNLGHTLRDRGKFIEALAALKRGHLLGSQRPGWPYPSARWVAECERLVHLDARLPAVLRGDERPKDGAEQAEFAALCLRKRWSVSAARFYQEVLATGLWPSRCSKTAPCPLPPPGETSTTMASPIAWR